MAFDQGWFVASRERLQFTYMNVHVTEASFARFVSTLARDVDAYRGEPRAVFGEAPALGALKANQRKSLADMLREREHKIAVSVGGYVLATPSPIVRGLLTAVFWVAPPPFQHRFVATAEEGFEWLAQTCSWCDAAQSLREYEELRAKLLPSLAAAS